MADVVDYLDLLKNEIRNAVVQVLASDPGSPVEGQIYYNSTDKVFKFYTGAAWRVLGRLDQVSAPTAGVAFNGQRATGLGDPSSAQDAATKAYVDAIAAGLSWKASVRVATTAAGTLASSFENGDTVDGITLATGDRILIKDQADPTENGIYVVAASGAPARAADANTGSELRQAAVFVEAGTTNADTGWVMTFNGTPTLGSDNITWTQFSGTSYTAGGGLTLTGQTLAVGAGSGIVVNADDVALDIPVTVARGGTGATDAATARGNLGVPGTYETDIDGSGTRTVTHNLNSSWPIVQVYRKSDNVQVLATIAITSANALTVTTTSGGAAAYRVRVIA